MGELVVAAMKQRHGLQGCSTGARLIVAAIVLVVAVTIDHSEHSTQ